MTDLKNPKLIYLKGFLLIALISWASARAYYFMFYVIEKYVDSNYKFSGVFSFIQYFISKRTKEK